MSKQIIHELATATQLGTMTFPQAAKGLLEAGVESYFVDFAARQKTHYLTDGTTYAVSMVLEPGPIATEFDGAGLVAAIRGAQSDTVRYPEFVKRATAAGVLGYCAFLAGKRVIYFSRKGEQHIEEFPEPRRRARRAGIGQIAIRLELGNGNLRSPWSAALPRGHRSGAALSQAAC